MMILPFISEECSLALVGGKGANLMRLAAAGFPVPDGFVVTTAAYRGFVTRHGLQVQIGEALQGVAGGDGRALERASCRIAEAFARYPLDEALGTALQQAYTGLGCPPVAVRSSATAEDLADSSFAGQHDTYLNITDAAALERAVIDCWASLWTARAIGYRLRNGLAGEDVALAVVVQVLVDSEVSGVLFTANPLTGLRSEVVIDATLGLGEALVSGQVEPDHYVIDSVNRLVMSSHIGAKALASRRREGGGIDTVPQAEATGAALSMGQLMQLAELGRRVEASYQAPQDIEWALRGEALYLLQSRPITSLYPLPEEDGQGLAVWFSFGAVQGMLGPITPLGQDLFRHLIAGAASVFGVRRRPRELRILASAGERLWVRISDVMRHPLGRRIYGKLLRFIEPSVAQALAQLAGEPALQRRGRGPGLRLLYRLLRFFTPVLLRAQINMHRPQAAREAFDRYVESLLPKDFDPGEGDAHTRLGRTLTFMQQRLATAFPSLLPRFVPLLGPSIASLSLMGRLAGERAEGEHGVAALVLEVTRGLPHNVTTEMDLALWHCAQVLAADAQVRDLFLQGQATELAADYLAGKLPQPAQQAIDGFMQRYGMRGVGEIDIGQPRWREEPTPVMQTLQSYLQIEPEFAPDLLFHKGEAAAARAIEALALRASEQGGGWWKQRLVRAAATRLRCWMGARETPKFFMIRLMGIMRLALLQAGAELVAAGTLERADDLFFLRMEELEALARGEAQEWQARVAQRRALYAHEERRRQVPRVLVSDGRAFYEGLADEADGDAVISGSPVSPGVVEGVVRIVHDPRQTRLLPGEILVCRGTDPAWTPLFMSAAGLITEVGGMMTHGSVVAREYGIPAVVGVHQATSRLQDGQRLRIDGNLGRIVVLQD